MYQTIYIDIVFLTNFLMDYMLLRLVGRFLHLGGSRFRCLASAALGAGFSCLLLYMPVRIVFPAGCSDSWKLCFFYGSFCVSAEEGLPAGKNNSGDVSYRFCGGRDLSGAGNRRNHDSEELFCFFWQGPMVQSLHTDLCGRNFPAVPEEIFIR